MTHRWTGDAAELDGDPAWLLVNRFEANEYQRAAKRILELLRRPDQARIWPRGLAEREFGLDSAIDRYDALYRQVLARPGPAR